MIQSFFGFVGIYYTITCIWRLIEKKAEGQVTGRMADTVIAWLLTVFLWCIFF